LKEDDRITIECIEACDRAKSASQRAQVCIDEAHAFLHSRMPPTSHLSVGAASPINSNASIKTRRGAAKQRKIVPFSTGLGKTPSITFKTNLIKANAALQHPMSARNANPSRLSYYSVLPPINGSSQSQYRSPYASPNRKYEDTDPILLKLEKESDKKHYIEARESVKQRHALMNYLAD